jgi:hypothetical protein
MLGPEEDELELDEEEEEVLLEELLEDDVLELEVDWEAEFDGVPGSGG